MIGSRIMVAGALCGVAATVFAAAPPAWQPLPGAKGVRSLPIARAPGRAGFTRILPAASGINFSNYVSDERGITNQVYYSGSGVALGDVDGDGLVDVYFCSLNGDNRLYRNLGSFKFQNITESSGTRCSDQPSTGVVLADVDGDGDLDLLVSSIGNGVRLFLNDGKGVFHEATGGLASHHATMTMTLADIDGDGDLDLYSANYRRDTFQDEVNVRFRVRTVDGRPRIVAVNDQAANTPELADRYYIDSRGAVQENGEADVLYLNHGKGSFQAVSWTNGAFLDAAGTPLRSAPLDWGLSAMFRDMNGDGAPDLYVCNDGDSPDRIWINDGSGVFRELAGNAIRLTSFSSMGVDFGDINRDGFDDFFVTDMLGYEHTTRQTLLPTRVMSSPSEIQRPAVPRNTLFLNRGDSTWAEIAQFAHVEGSDWTWCPAFLDVDLDGYEDLLITTGLEKSLRNADDRSRIDYLRRQGKLTKAEFLDARRAARRLDVPNFAFRNEGNLAFSVASKEWGFDARESSHGIALGDLDNDGDLDVVVSCLNAPPLIYRNDSPAPRIAVRLKGAGANTAGVGARIIVTGGPVKQSQQIVSGGRFLSSDDPVRAFAAGTNGAALTVEVSWRGGKHSVLTGAVADRIYEFDERFAVDNPPKTLARPNPLFSDSSDLLRHRHVSAAFDDFTRQPMLTRHLTSAGPGVCWATMSTNAESLIIGAGQGGSLAMFGRPSGGFKAAEFPALAGNALDDSGGIVCWSTGDGTNLLVFTQSTYKSGGTNAAFVYELSAAGARPLAILPAWGSSPGAIAASDLDGDGDLDLFVAGVVNPGRYPEPASSRVFRNNGTNFAPDEAWSRPFDQVGLVNSAVFSDLDDDGKPELVLACEWGPIKVFDFKSGAPVDSTSKWGLTPLQGWWQGIAAGDFDGDGRMDLIAGNWGCNHRYSRFLPQPIRIYYGDSDGDGAFKYFESYYDSALQKQVPARHWDMMAFRFPFLQQRVSGFADYATRSVEEVFGENLARFQMRSASKLDSIVLLNRGGRFQISSLPAEAQLSPVFGIAVADFDGDGVEDAFLAQNCSAVDTETSPLTAGRGALLHGNGDGTFRAMAATESGVSVYGNARGVAVADYDNDGRYDLCVGQNDGETKLFHNRAGRPGLRVITPQNARAVGARMRAVYTDGTMGPARELRVGSGWLSQDSLVPVLAASRPIKEVVIHWIGGKTTRLEVPAKAAELRVP